MAILTLIRHGQASFGTDRYDRLTELGKRQAAQTGRHLAQQQAEFDQVLIGPLQRQQETAEAILRELGASVPVQVVPALAEFAEPEQIFAAAERAHGQQNLVISRLEMAERMRHYGKTIIAWADGRLEFEGAASCAEFVGSVSDWLDQAMFGPERGQRVLVVTSAGVIAACMVRQFGLPVSRLSEFAAVIGNCSVTEFVFSRTRRSLLRFNLTSHLSGGASDM